MAVKINSATILGLECRPVSVEVDIAKQLNKFIIVGLPDQSVAEAKERVRLAVENSGWKFSRRKVVVNLAPADIKKFGSHYDLAIAIGALAANNQLFLQESDLEACYLGELSLTGEIKAVNGVLSVANYMKQVGLNKLYVPKANASEAALIKGLEIYPVKDLSQLLSHLQGGKKISKQPATKYRRNKDDNFTVSINDVQGQQQAKRALLIAAAGGHNILLSGPPGSGKTMLAKSLPSILPPLDPEKSLQVTNIYSIAKMLPNNQPLITRPPFRHPHHTASGISLIGGGSYPTPGEITLAHQGVLFLDEVPEFPRTVLENLRQPLEDKKVIVSRVAGTFEFPADFILIAAMNPCPCGWYSDPEKKCVCTPGQISKYHHRLSGPLLDRIDLHLEVPRLKFNELKNKVEKIDYLSLVLSARQKQYRRQKFLNDSLDAKKIKQNCELDDSCYSLLGEAISKLGLSPRSYYKVIKVARTIADLDAKERIATDHIAEALQYRYKTE